MGFWDHVPARRTGDGCWLWQGSKDRDGYGRLTFEGRKCIVHRVMYELKVGPIPDGMAVCHRCDTPACVNPSHLFVSTQKWNVHDAVQKNRTAHGTRNGRVKLTESDVRFIRALYQRCRETAVFLALGFDVHRRTVVDLLSGKNWRRLV